MMLGFDTFLNRLGVSPRRPASDAEIEIFENQSGLKLTPELRQLYTTTDGVILKKDQLEILPLAEVLELVRAFSCEDTGAPRLGYFPLTETFDSNYVCVCCDSLLRGYLVYVPHDDVPKLIFRDLGAFFGAILESVHKSDWNWFVNELPSDFENETRTEADTRAARNLLEVGLQDSAEDTAEIISFALSLFSENQLSELIPLLKFGNEYVRSDAQERIGRMMLPEAQAALQAAMDDYDAFIVRSVDALRTGGFRVSVDERARRKDAICLDDGPVWLNMDVFYSHSLGSGAFGDKPVEAVLLERAKLFLDEKQKNH